MEDRKLKPIFQPNDPIFQDDVMDPLGSWTGVPANQYEKPIQDADDL